jgi:hypothetical protein
VPQRHGKVAIDAKIEPLHRIAKSGGADGAAKHRLVDDGQVVGLQVFAAAGEPAEMGVVPCGILHRVLLFRADGHAQAWPDAVLGKGCATRKWRRSGAVR